MKIYVNLIFFLIFHFLTCINKKLFFIKINYKNYNIYLKIKFKLKKKLEKNNGQHN